MRAFFLFLCGATFMLACANGGDLEPSQGNGSAGRGGGGSGGGGSGGGGSGGGGSMSSSSAGSGGSSGATAGQSGSGGSGGSDMCDYKSPNTCATGVQMAEVAGDSGAAKQTQFGTTSQWLTIRVVESELDPVSGDEKPLSYTVSLQSPAGMVYDLFVQEGASDGGAVCNGTAVQGVGPSGNKTVTSKWNDDIDFGDDKDDHRYLSIEVRYVSGTECGAAAQWTLTVSGHT